MVVTNFRTSFAPVLLFLVIIAPSNAFAPYIKQFNIINARTGAFVRRLRQNDVLDFAFPYAVLAVAPGARRITFVSPFRVVHSRLPFAIPRDVKTNKFLPLRLMPGKHKIAAYADDDVNNTLSVSFTVWKTKNGRMNRNAPPTLPQQGPMPWVVQPSSIAKNVKVAHVPDIKPGCNRTTAPTVSDFVVGRSQYHYGEAQLEFNVNWCAGAHALRIRVLSFSFERKENGTYTPRTKVLSSETSDYFEYGSTQVLFTACKKQHIYVEVCGRRSGANRPLFCGTSRLRELFAFTVAEPVLTQRPPVLLRLGPGDSPFMSYAIEAPDKNTPALLRYRLQIAAVAKNGRLLGTSKWISGTKIALRLPLSGTRKTGVKPSEYDGAEVFLRFAYRSCPSNVATLRERESTKLVVEPDVSKLVKQDKRLPQLEKLVYPPTEFGQPVALTVRANNPGGGRRADGSRTRLTYQWFMRDSDYGFAPTYPKPIVGQTGPTLRLAKAECELRTCGRYGCSDMMQYSVLVCNTFGCIRSNVVGPNILPPNLKTGQKWNKYSCEIES